RLHETSTSNGLHFAYVDAKQTRLHMIDKVFHSIAAQIDWDELARSFLAKLLSEKAFILPPGIEGFRIQNIAMANHVNQNELNRDFKQWLGNSILRDYHMCKEFRIAMLRLCWAQLDPVDVSPSLEHWIKEW